MSTRAVINVFEKDGTPILSIYHHGDGSPDGYSSCLGQKLFNFMADRHIVNGIGLESMAKLSSNTMGDFAAQLIAFLKEDNELGGVYVSRLPKKNEDQKMAVETAKLTDAEYCYNIIEQDKRPFIRIYDIDCHKIKNILKTEAKLLFEGFPEEMLKTFNLEVNNTLAEAKHIENEKACAASWIFENIPFSRIEETVLFYANNDFQENFLEFIETVPDFAPVKTEKSSIFNLPVFSKNYAALFDVAEKAKYIDFRRISFGTFLQEETGINVKVLKEKEEKGMRP